MEKPEPEITDQRETVPEIAENMPEPGGDEISEEERETERKDTGYQEKENRRYAGKSKTESREHSFLSGFFHKAAGIYRGIFRKIQQVRKKATGIGREIRRLKDRKDTLLEFWNLEEHRRARGALFDEGKYLWKKSRPRKIKGQITFGFADPSHTGLCMGAVGMLCAWYPAQLRIVPDFDQEILKGDVLIKGRVRCYIFVRILLRIYFNKDIRHMYQHWQEL